jgi:CheY-like chemotaxis protein
MLNSAGTKSTAAPPTLRVLLVEDHPDLATVTAELLRKEGLDVQTALTGRDALEAAPAFRPQLVFCDLNLPDMMGLEVVRGIRSNPSTHRTYVVILTASSGLERMGPREAEQLGVDAFIAKPISGETIRRLAKDVSLIPNP